MGPEPMDLDCKLWFSTRHKNIDYDYIGCCRKVYFCHCNKTDKSLATRPDPEDEETEQRIINEGTLYNSAHLGSN